MNKEKNKYLICLILISPIFYRIASNISLVINEIKLYPNYLNFNIFNIIDNEKLERIMSMRWVQYDAGLPFYISKIFYNKSTLIFDKMMDLLTYFSPRYYFHSGDGSALTSGGVEPVPLLLFPFFIIGLFNLVSNKKYKSLFLLFISASFAFFSGERQMAYLIPVLLVYLYFAVVGISTLNNKFRNMTFNALIVYGVFILGRMVWLN